MLGRTYQFLRRHTRAFCREQICPSFFFVRGGRIYNASSGVGSVQTLRTAEAVFREFEPVKDALSGETYLKHTVRYPEAYVHRIEGTEGGQIRILACGGVLMNGRTLIYSGIHPYASMWETFSASTVASSRTAPTVVLPWAHSWYTFGDFMAIILPVTARIMSRMDEDSKQSAVYAISGLSSRPWVADYFQLLGIDPEQLVDLEIHKLNLSRNGVVWTASGIPHNGVTTHPHDFTFLRNAMLDKVKPASEKKLYLPRVGRRTLVDESKLSSDLRTKGYYTVEAGLSAAEQASLFAGADCIAGPHGGAFGNIVFSSNAELFEFQHPKWMVPCFQQIADFTGNRYRLALSKDYKPAYRAVHGYAHCDVSYDIEALESQIR